ncbi:hypothetical protein CRENBAI_009810 [Crenichthys baileyi]|uniref:Uncharacterized protein n=1 Tax=Crenichthys baileyi TaxID=28760 RepID=A0AAV9S158_9TELE
MRPLFRHAVTNVINKIPLLNADWWPELIARSMDQSKHKGELHFCLWFSPFKATVVLSCKQILYPERMLHQDVIL